MKRICFRCKKEINVLEDYFSFTEFSGGNFIKEDFAHKKCWDEFLSNVSSIKEAKGMLNGLNSYLKKAGILPPEEFEIK
jgi:hypothetical protein